jgi:hypothetical protein
MKIKVYVNWHSREVISEKEFEKRVVETQKEYLEDVYYFAEWLEDTYKPHEVWEFDREKREAVRDEYGMKCREWAENEVRDTWTEEEIEV